MSKTAIRGCAKALDIWDVIKRHIDFDLGVAIEEVTLHLDVQESQESYVDVSYYPMETITEAEMIWEEEPATSRFKLSFEDTNKMYSDIKDLVELPRSVVSLYAHLDHHELATFDVKMIPLPRD